MNVSIYKHVLPLISIIRNNNLHLSSNELVSRISVASGVPVIAIAYFFGQLFGYDEALNKQINALIKFYNYDSITGYEDVLPEVPSA